MLLLINFWYAKICTQLGMLNMYYQALYPITPITCMQQFLTKTQQLLSKSLTAT